MPSPILVTGAGGLVGSALMRAGGDAAVGLARADLDITDPAAVAQVLDTLRPRAVINAAAQAKVDLADTEVARTFRVNGAAPGLLGALCAERGIRLVHLSTDYVLDAPEVDWLTEDLPTRPRSTYARSKLAGEEAALAAGAVVVRVQWVYHPGHPGFFTRMLQALDAGERVRLVTDQTGCPTPAALLAPALIHAAQGGPTGLFHLATTTETSAWGWIAGAAQARGQTLLADPVTRDALGGAWRPARSCLCSDKFQAAFGLALPAWDVALGQVLSPGRR